MSSRYLVHGAGTVAASRAVGSFEPRFPASLPLFRVGIASSPIAAGASLAPLLARLWSGGAAFRSSALRPVLSAPQLVSRASQRLAAHRVKNFARASTDMILRKEDHRAHRGLNSHKTKIST